MRSFPFRAVLVITLVLVPALVSAFSIGAGPWPMSSEHPVEALDRPDLLAHAASEGVGTEDPFRLVVFGDQRALADGEWQAMNLLIAARERELRDAPPLLAIVDTGDIVFDGSKSDQFHFLTDILQPLSAYPYLVGVGNHEVRNNEPGPARENLVRYLGPTLGEDFTSERLYYRRDVAGLCLLFLDTNDLVYGPDAAFTGTDGLSYRGRAQLRWLVDQLADPRGARTTIAVLHHPLVSSSRKHRSQSAKLWNLHYDGRSLATILADGGVDLVLTGHTHTYERFRLTAPGGASFQLLNVSGRPRPSFLGLGRGQRVARDLEGEEIRYFLRNGWDDLDDWKIEQLDAMLGRGANQWVELVLVEGRIEAEVFYLVDGGRSGVRSEERFVVD